MSIEEKRRAAFEVWLELAGFDVERFHCINGYRGVEQMAAWEAWNAAIDSICVELPVKYQDEEGYPVYQACDVVDALTAAGVPYK